MTTDRKVYVGLGLVVAVIFAAILLYPQAKEHLAPELSQAWVAIEPEGAGMAIVGPVELKAGTPFTLHAVLQAEGREGAVYYTEASALTIDGQEVPAESLRPWDRPAKVRMLWQTVEGSVPYIKLRAAEDFHRFRWTEFLRLDWPDSWSIPGTIEPANARQVVRPQGREAHFGTQRYQVRIELYDDERQLVPTTRFSSWGSDQLAERVHQFPTVYAAAPGPLATPSLYFGLTHVELPVGSPELLARMVQLTRQRLAYEPIPLLGVVLEALGSSTDQLAWSRADLEAGPPWADADSREGAVAPGDLLQVGERWVVLYRDAGIAGVLDGQDLCLDFSAGAAIRALDEVFLGSGEVDLARLSLPAA